MWLQTLHSEGNKFSFHDEESLRLLGITPGGDLDLVGGVGNDGGDIEGDNSGPGAGHLQFTEFGVLIVDLGAEDGALEFNVVKHDNIEPDTTEVEVLGHGGLNISWVTVGEGGVHDEVGHIIGLDDVEVVGDGVGDGSGLNQR